MKKLFAIICAALLATALVSCDKEEEATNENGGNNQSSIQMGENQLVIDGVVYPFSVTLTNGMNFQAADANGQRFVINGGIMHTEWGETFDRTFDLTQPIEGIHCGFSFESSQFFYLVYDNTGEKIMGVLDNTEYDGESMFSSGTATVRYDGSLLYIKVDGTLKNGHTFGFIVSVSNQHHSASNGVQLDNQRYEYAVSLSVTCEGTYLFSIYDPTGNDRFHLNVDLPATSTQNPINLGSITGTTPYSLGFQTSGLSFFQQQGDDAYATFNNHDVESAFTAGGMECIKSADKITLTIAGTLRNESRFGATVEVPIADIEAMDNQIILNGAPYSCETLCQIYNGRYIFNASGNDCSGEYSYVQAAIISMTAFFDPADLGKTIDLSSSNPGSDYTLYASSLDQIGLYFHQSYWSEEGIKSFYGERVTDPSQMASAPLFSKGTLRLSEDEMAITVSVKGTLTDGRSVGMQIRADKATIINNDEENK